MKYDDPDLRDRLAAEYALGTLRGLARRRFERLMERDQPLRELATKWEMRLNRLAETAPAMAPPARVWQQISARLGFAETKRRSVLTAIFGGAQVKIPNLAEAGLWNFVGFWRSASLVAAAIALALYIASTVQTSSPISHLAVLNDQANQPAMVANLYASADRLVIRAVAAAPVAPGQALELWLLPAGGSPPVSLGLLGGAETILDLPPARTTEISTGSLAVSLEPAGGSPTGQPTGPVLFVGPVLASDS
ncbi:MAG: anti-sigma factor [Dongiaceae bacterium]